VSDITVAFVLGVGWASMMSTSSVYVCERPLIDRLTSVIVPVSPETTQFDGYGLPCPELGIVIAPPLQLVDPVGPELPVGALLARLAASPPLLPGAAELAVLPASAAMATKAPITVAIRRRVRAGRTSGRRTLTSTPLPCL
jgi:hypothetical protein